MFQFPAAAMQVACLQPPPGVARWEVDSSETVLDLAVNRANLEPRHSHYKLDDLSSILDATIRTQDLKSMKFEMEMSPRTSTLDRKDIISNPCSWMRSPNNIHLPEDQLVDASNAGSRRNRVRENYRGYIADVKPRESAHLNRQVETGEAGGRANASYGEASAVSESPRSPSPTAPELTTAGLCLFKSGEFHAAERKYRTAAAQGDLIALHNLGTMYLHGQGVVRDYTVAHGCFRRCSELGLSASMSQLGYMYLHGHGVRKSASEAFTWFSRAAAMSAHKGSSSDPYTHFHLGMMYILGVGVAKDAARGCDWLRLSAEEGFAPALYNLAVIYMNGLRKVPKNVPLAASLLMRAAALRDPYAQNNLATLYARGVVLKQDLQKARTLFRMAAKQGVSAAMFNLGEMYNNGIGVSQDSTKAARYYLRAATITENAEAEFNLACLFLRGMGTIKQDLELALHWFEKAAAHGHKGARNNATVLLSPHFNVKPPVRVTHTPPKPARTADKPATSAASSSLSERVKPRPSIRLSFMRLFS